jgi:hypothetical protein
MDMIMYSIWGSLRVDTIKGINAGLVGDLMMRAVENDSDQMVNHSKRLSG